MSNVDAIRHLASEHDLEFVDLDNYGVDPGAAEILPTAVSRRHHVVPVKRKFGTPVIAIANPEDVFTLDTLRSSIGRDFISVVASREQITTYLDRQYGSPAADDARSGEGDTGAVSALEVDSLEVDSLEVEVDGVLFESFEDPVGLYGSEFTATAIPVDEGPVEAAEDPGFRMLPLDPGVDGPLPAGNGSLDGSLNGSADGSLNGSADAVTVEDGQQPPVSERVEPDWQDMMAAPMGGDLEPLPGAVPSAAAADGPAPMLEPEADGGDLDAAPLRLPPGVIGYDPVIPDLPPSGEAFAASADELAAYALTVDSHLPYDGVDSASLAADLVEEAVATFEEQHADDEAPEAGHSAAIPPLAKALVDGGRVSSEDMDSVVEEHDRTGQSIARILTARKLVTEADLMWGMAQEMGLEFVDLDIVGVDLTEAGSIPEATARHHNVLVIANQSGTPVVAASNPTDVFAMDDLRTIMGRSFITVVATRSQISSYIGRAFHAGGDAADMAMTASLDFDNSRTDHAVEDIQSVTEEAPIVRYVNLLILQALNERASDIHIEPTAAELRIRYRIDGVLHDVSTAPRSIAGAVITRLKVMADMNIAEHRVPQDGRISLNVGSKGVDLRMATLPTIYGEKVVMRVLDKSSVVLGFADLGFDSDLLSTYESIYTKPYGTILVTGPTGSGKSTTLYTTLSALNSPEKNIITVEDPVELQINGINQVQLNVKAGLTFASALKAILRSDPDIVLVGEIRDKETAVIAVEAALTGHMVLATLHTNSAASTPMRLIEMGLEPFLVTSSLSAVLAQRLARRLCAHCREPYEPTEADIVAAGWSLREVEEIGGMTKVYRAAGCTACSNTGYRGRKALAELMPMTEEIERMIIEGSPVDEIHRMAVTQGMVTLRQSGLRKAIEGETTLEEVLRVVA